jgi:hypothetical protein
MHLPTYGGGWGQANMAGLLARDFAAYVTGMIELTGAGTEVLVKPIELPYPIDDNPGTGLFTLSRLAVRYFRNGGGDTLTLYLYRAPVAGGANPAVVATWDSATHFTTTAADTQFVDTATLMPIALDTSTYHYFLMLVLTAAGGNTLGVGDIDIDIDKAVVE